MGMPNHLILVRHGESEGNIATNAAKDGDLRWYTDEFVTTPGHRWRLTELGIAQATRSGEWLRDELGLDFDRFFVSPYVRTKETAVNLDLPGAEWMINRALRERDWGTIGALPRPDFESLPEYRLSALQKKTDPLYWVAPGGESIAGVAEDRVRNFFDTMHRECTGETVIAVTHADLILAMRLVTERMDDEAFMEMDKDKSQDIHNAEVLHYSRVNPFDGSVERRLSWLRRAYPALNEETGEMEMVVGEWQELTFYLRSNDALRAQVEAVPHLFGEGSIEG